MKIIWLIKTDKQKVLLPKETCLEREVELLNEAIYDLHSHPQTVSSFHLDLRLPPV